METRKPVNILGLFGQRTPYAVAVLLVLSFGLLSGVSRLAAQKPTAVKTSAAASPQEMPMAPKQKLFASPEEAMEALVDAAKSKDQSALSAILGPDREKLLSGDPVEDAKALEHFSARVQQSAKLEKVADKKATLVFGDDKYPFPIPIGKDGDQWRYDTKAGMEEILNRRIGENEISTILTCRAYVLAQWEYYTQTNTNLGGGLAVYAQKFSSIPGRHDGLYWETAEGEKTSPLGALVAQARAEGYTNAGKARPASDGSDGQNSTRNRSPYHGYYFKILKAQGPHAPGGKFSYVINGNMIAGYALVAYPDKWGSSGVMTFIVNNQGRIYEKNLGPKTVEIAAAMTAYDPDPSWKPVHED
jgi:hypothetical protein